ncbi:hypothetical protein PINS_up015758 [Pythium insidiosum]|nr:hypothetical protein PINS_up015758 [Pythium insidiosum]
MARVVYPALKAMIRSGPTNATFASISYDGSQVCGVTGTKEVWCLAEGTDAWQRESERIKSISIDGPFFYAIDLSSRLVWRDTSIKNSSYSQVALPTDISSSVDRVQVNGRHLCIQDVKQYLYCAKLENSTRQAWWFTVGNSTQTMIDDFSVASDSIAWVSGDEPGVIPFGLPIAPEINDTFSAVATDGNIVCASKKTTREVLCASRKTKSWRSIRENLSQMAIRNGTMYGVTQDGGIMSFKLAIGTEAEANAAEAKQRPITPAPTGKNKSGGLSTGAIVGIVLAAIGVIVVCSVIWRRRSQRASRKAEHDTDLYQRLYPLTADTQALTQESAGSEDQALTMWTKDEALLAKRIQINDLEFGPKVSRGAFGDVYRGRFDGQIVAIKVLAETKRCNLSEVSKFAQEARFMARLQHDHIACLVGVAWSTPSNLCIVSEFLAGGDVRALLQRYLNEGRPEGFSPDKIKIALHVAHALTYLHSLQPIVLHRDLKSKNILLTENGDAKLTDFGVSREMEDATMTAGVGSSLWMAPEVIQGERYDEKADVYSFGVVLSELDTNELPFAAAQREGVVMETETGSERKRLPEVAILQLVVQGRLSVRFSDNADPTLKEIGLACVAVDPSARPTTATVLYKIHRLWREMYECSD